MDTINTINLVEICKNEKIKAVKINRWVILTKYISACCSTKISYLYLNQPRDEIKG